MDDLTSATIKHWLESVQLTQYLPLFAANGYKELSQCASLTKGDLDRIGIIPAGHRKRLLMHLPAAKCSTSAASVTGNGEAPLPTACPGGRKTSSHGYFDMDTSSCKLPEQGSQASPRPVPVGDLAPANPAPDPHFSHDASHGVMQEDEEMWEEVYQVPPCRTQCTEGAQEEAVYVNVDTKEEEPPVLPPKQREHREKGGIAAAAGPPLLVPVSKEPPPRSESPKTRPVPAPRRSLMKKPTPMPRTCKSRQSVKVAGVTTGETSDDCGTAGPETTRTSSPASVETTVSSLAESALTQPVMTTTVSQLPQSEPPTSVQEERGDAKASSAVDILEVMETEEALENQQNEDLENQEASRADSLYGNSATLRKQEEGICNEISDEEDQNDYLPMSPPAEPPQVVSSRASAELKDFVVASANSRAEPNVCGMQKENDYEITDCAGASTSSRICGNGAEQPVAVAKQSSFDAQIPPEPSPAISEGATYQPIWAMGSGPSDPNRSSRLMDLIRFDSQEDASGGFNAHQSTKDATLFNEPPPSFAPPPLPPGVRVSRITGLPPPALPPRNNRDIHNYAASATPPKLDSASSRDSLGFWNFAESRAKANVMNQVLGERAAADHSTVPDVCSTDKESLTKPAFSNFDLFALEDPAAENHNQPFPNLARMSQAIDNTYGNLQVVPPSPIAPGGAGGGRPPADFMPCPPAKAPSHQGDHSDPDASTYSLEEFVGDTPGKSLLTCPASLLRSQWVAHRINRHKICVELKGRGKASL